MLVSGSYDEAVMLWDVRSARMMRSLPAHSDPVGGVDFVHDGTLIVSCAGDGLMYVFIIYSPNSAHLISPESTLYHTNHKLVFPLRYKY